MKKSRFTENYDFNGGDKEAHEQLRLISELDKDDMAIIFRMIDKMLTSKKFKDFFNKNMASL